MPHWPMCWPTTPPVRSSLTSCVKQPPRRRPDSTPTLTPPAVKEETTVLENVTQISREYGEQLSSRFSQLWRNITGSPHKPFNPQTFTQRGLAFFTAGRAVFAFWWLVRLAALPVIAKWANGDGHKNRDRGNWLQLPLTIAGAFIIDLLLLALTLFVGQLLSDRLNGNNPTIAFQQSLSSRLRADRVF
ncbi:Potassium efflux system KefA protein / Small-conductance mechanosensitive channel [Klebsiella pneumoniae]|uniref:Potassium efflux system KefA protein / Small-conductance mechanosensitive channel n=1 Tax=Klebsiella pneumoniae TaxID=573 RepID=A0A377W4B3_KLEPN|nr:Potassium efflux system KefA protein / Small-conductance mechanosensitive channel [Klebsiella pneumoniae]